LNIRWTNYSPTAPVIAIPAAAAGLAYLNARWRVPDDARILKAVIASSIAFARRERQDRVNSFYILEAHVQNPKVANEPFLVFEGRSWTFKQVYDLVLRYAGWLHSTHNVTKGEFVAVNMMNSAHYDILVLAIWSLGAIPALINYNLVGDGFVHSIKAATARLLITEPEIEAKTLTPETLSTVTAPNFRNNTFPLEIATLSDDLQKSLAYFPPYRAPDAVRAGVTARDPSVVIYTSGTTGLPKAALVAWQRLVVTSHAIHGWMSLQNVTKSNPDRYYSAMPLYHSSAFQLNFHTCLIGATTSIISRKFSASAFWDEVTASNATAIQYVGETLRYLLAAKPRPDDRTRHNVRLAFGNGLRPDVWERFRTRFGVETIVEFYGATEGTGGLMNFNRNSFSAGAIGSAGLLMSILYHITFTVVAVDWETEEPARDPSTGLCRKVPDGTPGELLARLDANDIGAKFQGYHGNPEATNKKILRDVLKKGDAYFRTGDVVMRDSEGRVWFSDRIGDTFRWKSENVSTAQVGEVLGHHPSVLEANVYGVTVPGHEGRAGCAALMLPDEAYTEPQTLTPKPDILASLAAWNTNNLPKYAIPVFLRFVKELTVTGTNKQQKPKLRMEGVDPARTGSDPVYMLRPGTAAYTRFSGQQWKELEGGQVKL
jgi:acyl-CoA synthetase (AMP-forming)/AMP-acid ligase II